MRHRFRIETAGLCVVLCCAAAHVGANGSDSPAQTGASDSFSSYLVYVAGRADLDDLSHVADREVRGRQVVERLQATARRSQAAVIHVLRELQDAGQVAGFRSHFISNVISVSATEA
ncbi:MAG: hypothetical protein PVG53_05605, partial [Holophagae bacterium]